MKSLNQNQRSWRKGKGHTAVSEASDKHSFDRSVTFVAPLQLRQDGRMGRRLTTSKIDLPQVWEHYDCDGGGYRKLRDMTPTELAKREAGQQAYEDMLARQAAYMKARRQEICEAPLPIKGCVFAKSCNLPGSVINYSNHSGYIPTEFVKEYGAFTLLGGRQVDESGCVALKKISGTSPANIGVLALRGAAFASIGAGAITGTKEEFMNGTFSTEQLRFTINKVNT